MLQAWTKCTQTWNANLGQWVTVCLKQQVASCYNIDSNTIVSVKASLNPRHLI